jgi:RimJ/RimL family protein N-acetyltransferase
MRIIGETERLIVREWTDSRSDVQRNYDIYSLEEVTKWLGGPGTLADLEAAEASNRRRMATYERLDGRYGVWAVQVRDTGKIAGSVLLLPLPDPADRGEFTGAVEIGWHLHPDSWGFGYATEAARAVLDHGFSLGLDQILAIAMPDNGPSLAVMRRLGMTHLGRTTNWFGFEAELFRMSRTMGQ